MFVVPTGNTKLSHIRVGLPGIGQDTCGMPVRTITIAGVQLSVAVATPSSSSSKAEQVVVVTSKSGGIVNTGGIVFPVVGVGMVSGDEQLPMALVRVQVITVCPACSGGGKCLPSLRRGEKGR